MIRTASLVVAFMLAMHVGAIRANAVDGLDSLYQGESAFLSVGPGQTYTFQVFFANIGTVTWKKGTSTQVSLAACLPDKVTCNIPSPNRTWNDGSWISDAMYTTQAQPEVVPNQIGTFIYFIKVPLNVVSGNYRFHGDLVQHTTRA